MVPRVRLLVGLLLILSWVGFASGQRTVPSLPPVEKSSPAAVEPKLEPPATVPPLTSELRAPATQEKAEDGALSNMLTLFIYVALVVGVIIALVVVVALYFRLRAADDPLVAALDDAWVQGRLRELEAAPPEPEADEEVPAAPAEVR